MARRELFAPHFFVDRFFVHVLCDDLPGSPEQVPCMDAPWIGEQKKNEFAINSSAINRASGLQDFNSYSHFTIAGSR